MTPLHNFIAERREDFRSTTRSMLLKLISSGADLRLRDKTGRTALDIFLLQLTTSDSLGTDRGIYTDGLLAALSEDGRMLGSACAHHGRPIREKLLPKLIAQGAPNDAGLVLMALFPVLPDGINSINPWSLPDMDPQAMFPNFERSRQPIKLNIIAFLALQGASDDQLLHFFRPLLDVDRDDPRDYTTTQHERFKGERRLAFRLAAERGLSMKRKAMRTATLAAASTGDLAALRTFVEDLDWNVAHAENDEGRTALSLAAAEGHLDVVRYLLERKVPTEVKDEMGRTALSRAAMHGQLDVVKMLMEYGAAVAISVEELVRFGRSGEVVEFLRDYEARMEGSAAGDVEMGNAEMA